MKNFIDITNRLKIELGLSTDKQIADLLGLTKSAFAERKKRNSFPEKELQLLAAEKGLDAEYIINGFSERREEELRFQAEFFRKNSEYIAKNKNIAESKEFNSTDIEILPIPDDAYINIKINNTELFLLSRFRQSYEEHQELILAIAKMARTVKDERHRNEILINEKIKK